MRMHTLNSVSVATLLVGILAGAPSAHAISISGNAGTAAQEDGWTFLCPASALAARMRVRETGNNASISDSRSVRVTLAHGSRCTDVATAPDHPPPGNYATVTCPSGGGGTYFGLIEATSGAENYAGHVQCQHPDGSWNRLNPTSLSFISNQ